MWKNNNNLTEKDSLKNCIGDSSDDCPAISEDDEDLIELENSPEALSTAQSEPFVLNYVYNASEVDTSAICDLGFRNMESIVKLSKEDFRALQDEEFEKLSLSHNALKKIPSGFFSRFPKLQMIMVLDLSCNQLAFIPNDIDYLVNLTHLNLFLNKLRCLPPSLSRLTQLKWLNLAKNPDLFKSEILSNLAGPMLTEQQCCECATNVKQWINGIMERRLQSFRNEIDHGERPSNFNVQQAGVKNDEYLIRYYPDDTNKLQNENYSFLEEPPVVEFEFDALRKEVSTFRIIIDWVTKLWMISILVTIGVSAVVGPFIFNEPHRRYYTEKCLIFIPHILVELAVALGKAFHDLLWGLPCQLFHKEACTYCNPKVPDFWDLFVWKWMGSSR